VPVASADQNVILVVEDNPDDVALIQTSVNHAGHLVSPRFVTDGEQAVAYLEGRDPFGNRRDFPFPGLVVLDLQIPGRDGIQILKWIRSHPRFESLQVVVWTGREDPNAGDRARAAGANLFLRKPMEAGGWINFLGIIALALQRSPTG
jgi:CheY-like chemotaxis protein